MGSTVPQACDLEDEGSVERSGGKESRRRGRRGGGERRRSAEMADSSFREYGGGSW